MDSPDVEDMSALHLAVEGRDYLMWCPDAEFDRSVSALDMRGLVELIHTLQEAMAVEQQTFESLSQQLEQVEDPLLQQRMSAALCTSQTRLARLCSRNMRCFTQQALKSRQREQGTQVRESVSSLPAKGNDRTARGLDEDGLPEMHSSVSSSESPPSSSSGLNGTHSFKNSLAFFQRAAGIVSNGSKSSSRSQRHRTSKRSSKRDGGKSSVETNSCSDPLDDDLTRRSTFHPGDCKRFSDTEDNETYEQVLYINGRPQFQIEGGKRSHSYDPHLDSRRSRNGFERTSIAINSESGTLKKESFPGDRRSCSWTRVQIRPDSGNAFVDSVDSEPPYRSVAFGNPAHSRSLGDVTTCVTLPRRKPVLNFSSVSDEVSEGFCGYSSSAIQFQNAGYHERFVETPLNNFSTITRSRSFKEGLDLNSEPSKVHPLTRAQSLYDGLDTDFKEESGTKTKLSRVPSVDEILESVKTLRAKKSAMVKSSPDLLQISQEKSSSRHKNGKSSKGSKNTSNGLVHQTNGFADGRREKSHKTMELERLRDSESHYYENIGGTDGQYENLPIQNVEVIYDSPKSSKVIVEKQRSSKRSETPVDHYENINFDPLYENIDANEPTYMNVTGKPLADKSFSQSSNNNSNLYVNLEQNKTYKSTCRKVRSGNSVSSEEENTYDVPKAATHIYDTPPKQTRKVRPQPTSKRKPEQGENEYDTPHNNRSVLPPSSKIPLKEKNEQIKKIEDIFADCEKDSLDGDAEDAAGTPDIPPPDYGSEDEELAEKGRSKPDASPSTDYIDEGLGESDSRSYYADEQGLEVILEEPEDDYSSSHSSAEDLRRRLDVQLRLKGERRSLGSLEGSEGIGSAEGEEEGDFHSSGSSEGGAEEDCGSSGIHSEDTSSPGPPSEHPTKDQKSHPSSETLLPEDEGTVKKDEDRTQQDRCVEVYPETIRQRQRTMAPSPSKVDIKNWEPNAAQTDENGRKFLPSVKALRNQFENGKTPSNALARSSSNSSSTNSLVMPSLEASSGFGSMTSSQVTLETSPLSSPHEPDDEPVEPIFNQFKTVDDELKEMMSKPPSTQGWNPTSLLKRLYYIPEAPKMHRRETPFTNIEGYLEKLPSGRKKATFWNAWKRRYFVAKDGVLYYYQNNQTEKPNMKLPLMGGKIEIMDPSTVSIDDGGRESKNAGMLGIDDGKGHYVVVRCSSRQEAERWKSALDSHTVEDFCSQYIQPWPRPTNPTLLRDTLVIDIGSCSVRAGVLASQPTLPQLFIPSVAATNRETKEQIFGMEALIPEVRSTSTISFPIRPSHKISKFSVDLNAVSSLLQKTFTDLKVDPKNYNIQLSVPRVLNPNTQAELLKILFDKFGVKSVNLTHQSILALYAYNATSGIVVDIGERLDVVPIIDGYIVDGGVSRVPYGGYRIMDHLRQFLFQKNISLANEVDSYVIRQVLETICYCAQHYNTEKQRCTMNPGNFEKSAPLAEHFPDSSQFEAFKNINLDFGRFQATEGLFNPDAWGLDHPGLHKLVHKAIQECSMDIRKEMSRSIFLVGGATQLPGLADRLTVELDNLTPPAIRPKVHASPYRYHASYLGACVLAESPAFAQSRITKEEWTKQGNSALRKWAV